MDLPFLNIHNPVTNVGISVYLDKHNNMSLDTKDYLVKQTSHLSKGVVIVSPALCQLYCEVTHVLINIYYLYEVMKNYVHVFGIIILKVINYRTCHQ